MVVAHESLVALRQLGLYRIACGDLRKVNVPVIPSPLRNAVLHAWEIHREDSPNTPVGIFEVLKGHGENVFFRLLDHEGNMSYHLDSRSGLTFHSSGSVQSGNLDEQTHDLIAGLFTHLGRELTGSHKDNLASLLSSSKSNVSKHIRRQQKRNADRRWLEIKNRRK